MKLLIIIFCISIYGCSHPDVLKINLKSVHELNLDLFNRPKPLAITIYSLTKPLPFKTANYSDLTMNPIQALSNALIDTTTLELVPNQRKEIIIDLTTDTKYIGIIAAYHNLETSIWKQLISLKDNNWPTQLNIYFGSNRIGFDKEKVGK